MELDVLKGCRKTIRRFPARSLYIENEAPDLSRPLLQAILDLGYVAYWHIVPLFVPANFRGNATNLFSGIVCISNLYFPAEIGAVSMQGFLKVVDPGQHPRRRVAAGV